MNHAEGADWPEGRYPALPGDIGSMTVSDLPSPEGRGARDGKHGDRMCCRLFSYLLPIEA